MSRFQILKRILGGGIKAKILRRETEDLDVGKQDTGEDLEGIVELEGSEGIESVDIRRGKDMEKVINEVDEVSLIESDSDVPEIAETLDSHTKAIDDIKSEIEKLNERISSIESMVKALEQSSTDESFSDLELTVRSLEERIASETAERINEIEKLRNSIKTLENSVNESKSEITKALSDMSELLEYALWNSNICREKIESLTKKTEEIEMDKGYRDKNRSEKEEVEKSIDIIDELEKDVLEKGTDEVDYEEKQKVSSPILTKIGSDYQSRRLAMKWIEFLTARVGTNNLPELLEYYVEVGWISDDVMGELLRYAEGIEQTTKEDWKLSPEDHVRSFWFVWRLAGHTIERTHLTLIKKEIERIEKRLDIPI